MKLQGLRKIIALFGLLFLPFFTMWAQGKKGALEYEVDYNNPRRFVLAGVRVEGNKQFSQQQIIQLSGLRKGTEVVLPSDAMSSVISRIWAQRYFKDVALLVDSLSSKLDSVYLKIVIKEHSRVSHWSLSGVKSGENKDVLERLNLRKGGEFSPYVESSSVQIIKRFYAEKGFLNAKVKVTTKEDSLIRGGIRVNFAVDRGEKLRIKKINFIGKKDISDYRLSRSMKKTKSAKFYNFFNSKKFNEKEYDNDKRNLISAFNELGYRDARIVRDSIYNLKEEPNKLAIDFVLEQGNRYYFRNITWTGNTVYSSKVLNNILKIKKGDPYDVVTMQKRLFGGGKQNDYDISKLYRDNGYLFFQVNPVELAVVNDSIDVEMRIFEGKPATINKITIAGNGVTEEKVVRRQIFSRPGYLFSQSDFERSIREIASLGQFEPEAIMDGAKGYSIIPNQSNNTVDINFNVEEKSSNQFELSGGWNGYSFVGTVGINFNNFSISRFFKKNSWRPVPQGEAQSLSFRFQTSGSYYTAISSSFTEPWLFGKKPTSLSLSTYYTKQTDSYLALNIFSNDKQFEVFGFSASLGNRLKWPDNYFVLYNSLSWQTYKLTNWLSDYFIFNHGISHNVSYTISLSRNSMDQMIFPRQGSDLSLSLQFTPPFSLFRRTDLSKLDAEGKPVKVDSYKDIDYRNWKTSDHYRWIEFHKWKFSAATYTKLIGNLVLMTRFQFGYLGYYNKNWGYSPFEGFLVGGDGMSGYANYGTEVISLRGYENYSLTPKRYSFNKNVDRNISYSGNVYNKFTFELRYPLVMQPQSTIYGHVFFEGGNCWADIKDFNPFKIKRAAGVGVRIFLPVVGLLGLDWGYGFDDPVNGKSHIHFVLGQQF